MPVFRQAPSCENNTCFLNKADACFNSWMLGNFSRFFLSSADFFQNQLFSKKIYRNTISVSNSLGPDLDQHSISPDWDQTVHLFEYLSSDKRHPENTIPAFNKDGACLNSLHAA